MLALSHLIGFGAFTPASASSYISSVQPFEITIGAGATSNTGTIASVDTTRSVIFFSGFTTTHNGTALREFVSRVALTNATTVTAMRDTANATHTVTVRGTVVEFAASAVSSVQQGTITIASGSTSGTATISSVSTSRSAVFYEGLTATTSTTSAATVYSRIDLTNSTTVTANRAASSTAILTVGFFVVEFAAAVIASIQPRSVTLAVSATSSTDTITSVNTANTMLLYNGVSANTSTLSTFFYNLALTNSTTVTLNRTGTSSTSRTINYTAVEFAPGVLNSLQRNTTAIASAISADSTITSVNTAKSVCNGVHFSQTGTTPDNYFATAKLLNATTVRAEKNTSGAVTSTPSWEVLEFV